MEKCSPSRNEYLLSRVSIRSYQQAIRHRLRKRVLEHSLRSHMCCKPERRQTLGIRFLVEYSRKRTGERGMSNKLAAEIVDACNSTGGAVKKKDDMHRQAEANKAFAHYRY